MLLLGGLITSSAGGSSGSTTGKRTRLTAQEVAQKANISVERAEDVIKILNWQLSKEKFTHFILGLLKSQMVIKTS